MTTEQKTTEQRITQLETQIDKLQARQSDLYDQLAEAQIEQWQGRLDDLEIQIHLAAMEANEHLTAMVDQLRTKWAKTRVQMEGAGSATTEVVDTLRTGIENAYGELHKAVLESRQKVSH